MKGSQKHIRWYVNEGRAVLNCLIQSASPSLAELTCRQLNWVSPLAPSFEEYWNEAFLKSLGLSEHLVKFKKFWPFRETLRSAIFTYGKTIRSLRGSNPQPPP